MFGKVLDYAIRIKLNPKDWVDGKKLCALLRVNPPLDWGGDEILSAWSKDVVNSSIRFPQLQAELLRALEEMDIENPNIPKFEKIFNEKLKAMAHANDSDEDRDELERSITELEYFRRSWTRFKGKGLGDSLLTFRNALALGQLAEDVMGNGLTLSTVHTMKGLEKDIVFILGMCEGVFPDYRAKTKDEIDEISHLFLDSKTSSKILTTSTIPFETSPITDPSSALPKIMWIMKSK